MVKGIAIAGTFIAGALAWIAPAHAEVITITVLDNGTTIGTATSSSGTASFTGTDASFSSISVSANGVPVIPNPDLSSTTLDASAATGFSGTHVLTVDVLQMDLASFTGSQDTTGTFNALVGAPGPVTENMLVDGTTIVTQTLTGPVSSFGPITTAVTGVTSDMEQFMITFDAPSQSASASMQFTGHTTTIPEPASMALLGAGLAGLGLMRRRRKTS